MAKSKTNETNETTTAKRERKPRGPSKPAEFRATKVIQNTTEAPLTVTLQPGEEAFVTVTHATYANQKQAKAALGGGVQVGELAAVIRLSFGPKTAEEPKRVVSSVVFR